MRPTSPSLPGVPTPKRGGAFFYSRFSYPGGVALFLSVLAHASLFGSLKTFGNSRASGQGRGVYEVDLFSRGIASSSAPKKIGTAKADGRPAHRHPRVAEAESVISDREPPASSDEGGAAEESGLAGYGEDQVDVAAQMLTALRLRYPAEAYRDGREADVVLFLVVDSNGRVVRADVTEPAGHGFDEAAQEATRALRFSPAQKDGRAVPVHLHWTCRFRIEG